MGWNYRILAHKDGEDLFFQIHEVYYDKNGCPNGHTLNPVSVGSENIRGITWTLNRMQECRKRPVLWAGGRFPQECKIKYKCELCGRDTFDKPTPHVCKGGYRKKGLKWTVKYL